MTSNARQAMGVLLATAIAAALLLAFATSARGQSSEGSTEGIPKGVERQITKNLNETMERKGAELDPDAPQEDRVDEDPQGYPYVAGELIVTYEDDLAATTKDAVTREFGAQTLDKLPEIEARNLSFPEIKAEGSEEAREQALEEKKQAIEQDPRVEAVDYNYVREAQAIPNDPNFNLQWGLPRISAPQAWDTTQGNGAIIAVLDGGIDQNHPELASKIDAQIDTVNNDAVANDEDGHGTHVAGIAAAISNNGQGIAGTAPGARLQIAKVLGATGGTDATVAAGIDWAISAPAADVINMSLGGCAPSTALENAVNRAAAAGTVVVASAGNNAETNNCTNYPAAYPNAIAVGAVNQQNGKSNFSTFGSFVDVAAPGGQSANQGASGCFNNDDILSTLPPGAFGFAGGYGFVCGTSMASPFVAGQAALLASQGLSSAQIRQRIESTTTDLGVPGLDPLFGHGLVNAQRAVTGGGTTNPCAGNTRPSITNPIPRPLSTTRDRTPRVQATVVDREFILSKANIAVSVDNRLTRRFSYASNTGKLIHVTNSLAPGRYHFVGVGVKDPCGAQKIRIWKFKVQ